VRSVLALVHLWVGLVCCVPFVLLGVTGSILVYEKPIGDWLQPPPHASAQGKIQSVQAIIDAVASARTDLSPAILTTAAAQGDAAVVYLVPKRGAAISPPRSVLYQAFIDPVSLKVLDIRESVRSPFLAMMYNLHSAMLIGGRAGRAIVGWLGLGMTGLGLSGLAIWWPRAGAWRGAYGIKRGARGWLFYRQLHGTIGITAWILFVTLSVSGVAMAFPQTASAGVRALFGRDRTASAPPLQRSGNDSIQPAEGTAPLDADKASALALQAVRDTHVAVIFLPNAPGQLFRINLLHDGAVQDAPPITALVDPSRAQIVDVRDPWAGGTGSQVINWQRPLHTGRGTYALYRAAIFLVGLLPPVFAVTGASMWWIKRRQRRRAA
jgi:uncharacterized iron-regulated membrane protein